MYRLMIVEDEDTTRDGLVYAVPWKSIGVEVACAASDGAEALEMLNREGGKIDLILTDIKMDKLDGLAMIEEIRKISPKIKIMVLSGYDESAFIRRSLDLKVSAYLLKPVRGKELLERISRLTAEIAVETEEEKEHQRLLRETEKKEDGPLNHFSRRALDFIETRYSRYDLSLQTLAEYMGINSSYLSRLFREKTGSNFTEVLVRIRMEKARTLLAETDIKIARVAEESGFQSAKYFCTLFKKHNHCTPAEYRNRNRRGWND